MKQLLLLIVLSFRLITVTAQSDSVMAGHIKIAVETIESNLEADLQLNKDTTIIDKEGNMTVHTIYYIDKGSGEVEKITEKTLFGEFITEIVVYYNGGSPILFSTKQWQSSQLKLDFDYYFQANSPIYLVKRTSGKGNTNREEILNWCDQLMKEADNKKLLVKNSPDNPVQKKGPTKKITETKPTDSTKKATTTKKPLFPFFKKKKN